MLEERHALNDYSGEETDISQNRDNDNNDFTYHCYVKFTEVV